MQEHPISRGPRLDAFVIEDVATAATAPAMRPSTGTSARIFQKETTMNSDEVKGKAEQLKGKVKQGVGDMIDDPELKDEGLEDEAKGEAQGAFGTAKRKVGEIFEKAGKAIKS
jgi:uncharacterized protein YjbJ (UPF0337 family)